MADDGFREIQLSGKQLAALFMGAAVVLVVTFLCGVLVGRGVRTEKEPVAAEASPALETAGDPPAANAARQTESVSQPAQPPTTPPPTPAEEDLSSYSRLEGKPGEAPKPGGPPAAQPVAPPPSAAMNATPTAKTPKEEKAAAVAPGEPPGQGFAVRVAAYRGRAQAEALAGRLAAKGYGTWVVQLPATTTGPALYSVRVGKYKTNKEADAAIRRLRKEEKLKPSLITR